MKRRVCGVGVLVLWGMAASACDEGSFGTIECNGSDCPPTDPTGGSSGMSGASSGGNSGSGVSGSGASGGSTPCDDSRSPFAEPCVLDGAIFVAPAGDGDGSRTNPFGSLRDAIAAAIDDGAHDVVLCSGTYDEAIFITDAELRITGGFDCQGWEPSEAATILTAPADTPVIHVQASSVELAQLSIEARRARSPGASSIAVLAEDSDIRVEHGVIEVGDGADGADGVLEPFDLPPALTGAGAEGSNGGPKTALECPAGDQSVGGTGGSGAPTGGGPGAPKYDKTSALGGQGGASCGGAGYGGDGGDAPPVEDAPGATSFGRFDVDTARWLPASGQQAAHGLPGQGGGGGGGKAGYGGGAGGTGTCGGAGGGGGQGGGASIAFLTAGGTLTLASTAITLGDGGQGGAGAFGQTVAELEPAFGGNGSGGGACQGGTGGKGSAGGRGGGGAGGLSVAVLLADGADVDLGDASITLGTEGSGGEGSGDLGAGVIGVATETLELD